MSKLKIGSLCINKIVPNHRAIIIGITAGCKCYWLLNNDPGFIEYSRSITKQSINFMENDFFVLEPTKLSKLLYE